MLVRNCYQTGHISLGRQQHAGILTEIIGFATSAGCEMESLLFAVTWVDPSRTGLSMRSSKLVWDRDDFVFIASRRTHEKDLESTSV